MPSTVIRYIDYDEATRTLRVTFVSGDVYAYDGVPPDAYQDFRTAFSKGQWFGREIRPRYAGRLVSRDPDRWRPGSLI